MNEQTAMEFEQPYNGYASPSICDYRTSVFAIACVNDRTWPSHITLHMPSRVR